MKKIYKLALEITRKCNLNCKHCLRGPSENKDMSYETLYETLKNIDEITYVCFTGGEPTLNLDAIKNFIEICREFPIRVDNFHITTNGKKYSQELVDLCEEMYFNFCYDGDSFLCVSRNKYQNEDLGETPNGYMDLSYYSDSQYKLGDRDWDILKMGNAETFGVREIPQEKLDTDGETIYGEMYVNVNGYIISGCDWSYEIQEKLKCGSVYNWDDFVSNL